MDEWLRDLGPPVIGLLAAGAGLLYARYVRRQAARREKSRTHAPRPAE